MKRNKRMSTETLTLGAILTATVVILQYLAILIKVALPILPFTVSLVLIPIVIGAAKCGPWMGAWLGFVFGVIVLISGDAAAFLAINPFGTVLTVLVKGTLCGLASGLVYWALAKDNLELVGLFTAAAVCPIVNTGIFLLGCLTFFFDAVKEMAGAADSSVFAFLIVGFVGLNFVFELLLNLLLTPALQRIITAIAPKKKGSAPLPPKAV